VPSVYLSATLWTVVARNEVTAKEVVWLGTPGQYSPAVCGGTIQSAVRNESLKL